MKKIISVFIFLLILITGCNKTGKQATDESKIIYDDESDFDLRLIDDRKAIEIIRYAESKKEIRIPPQIRGFPVTRIWGFANKNIISVTIPGSVTSIGGWAFASNQLTGVTIPDSVTSIGEVAFASNQLTSVTIPRSVTSIGRLAFVGNQLTSVAIPDSVTSIGEYAFADNPLTSVTIGANVTLEAVFSSSSFKSGFEASYADNGKAAGTYTRPDTKSTTWTKQ